MASATIYTLVLKLKDGVKKSTSISSLTFVFISVLSRTGQ